MDGDGGDGVRAGGHERHVRDHRHLFIYKTVKPTYKTVKPTYKTVKPTYKTVKQTYKQSRHM